MRTALVAAAVLLLIGCGGNVDREAVHTSSLSITPPSRNQPFRPPNVPPDFILTHNGYFHPSCVVLVKAHEGINGDGDIVQADGTVRKLPPCIYPHYDSKGNPHWGVEHFAGRNFMGVFQYPTGQSITWFSNDFVVPSNPSSNQADLSFWGGIENTTSNPTTGEVIQPVLDYGDFGTNHWQVRAENCCFGYRDYFTDYASVNVGDTISGYVYPEANTICSGYDGQWFIGINVNGTFAVGFDTCEFYSPMTIVDGGVFEINGTISSCGGLPQGGTITFNDVSVYTNGNPYYVSNWNVSSASNLSPDCYPAVSAYGSSGTMWWDY